MWFDTAPAGATVDAEQELTPGRYVLALPEYHVLGRFTVDEGGGGSALTTAKSSLVAGLTRTASSLRRARCA